METPDPHTWLAEHGDYLFRMARRQLRSDALAEDAVQEVFMKMINVRFQRDFEKKKSLQTK